MKDIRADSFRESDDPELLTPMIMDTLFVEYTQGITTVEGSIHYPTIQELLEKNGLDPNKEKRHYRRISDTATRKKWMKHRKQFQEDLKEAERLQKIKKLASNRIGFDSECYNIASVGLQNIKKHFNEYMKDGEAVPVKDLERLSRTVAKFQVVGRLALGDSAKEIANVHADEGLNTDNLTKEELYALSNLLAKANGDVESD